MPLVPLPPEQWQQLQAHRILQEPAFTSRTPVVGPLLVWFRSLANSISTKWYVRAVLQQQNVFNQVVYQHLLADDERMAGLALQIDGILSALTTLTEHQQNLQLRLNEMNQRIISMEAEGTWVVADHDQWLIEQDREAAVLVRNLAELSIQTASVRQALLDLTQRVEHLEVEAVRHGENTGI